MFSVVVFSNNGCMLIYHETKTRNIPVAKVKKSAPKKEVRSSDLLKIMTQDTVNDGVIEGMVKEESLVYELQN